MIDGWTDRCQTDRQTEKVLAKPLMQIQFRSPQQLHIMRQARFRTWQPSSGRRTSPLVPLWMRCYTTTLFHLSLLGGNTNIYALTIPVHQLNWNHIFRSVEAASNEILTAWFFFVNFFFLVKSCLYWSLQLHNIQEFGKMQPTSFDSILWESIWNL